MPTSIVAAAVALGTLAGCGGLAEEPPPTGSINIQSVVSGRLVFSSIDFQVSGNGIVPVDGTILVGDDGATVSAAVGGLPTGSGYRLALSATTDDRGTFCAGAASFDVAAPDTTALAMSLVCINANTVRVIDDAGSPHTCPSVASVSVARTRDVVVVSASAFSFDALPRVFAWAAPLGSFSSPDRDTTAYACDVPGPRTLTVTLTDGICGDEGLISVTCPGRS